MKISDNVIIGSTIAHKAPRILAAIKRDKNPSYKFWYAVTTAVGPEDMMYIISSEEYGLPFYRKMSLRLLGLAGSRNEADEIVTELVKRAYEQGKITELKSFL
jgi:hypothetical protein